MLRRRRDEIENFCRNFLMETVVTSSYANLFVITNVSSRRLIQQLFTKDTFDGSLQSICNDVFTRRPVSNGYIIAILGFTTQTSLHFFLVHYRYTYEFVS